MARTYWPPRRYPKREILAQWGFSGTNTTGRMKWTVAEKGSVTLEMPSFNSKLMRKGDTFRVPLARTTSYPLIGAVALHWGDFETRMDRLLASFVVADADPNDQGWQRRAFSKRRALLKAKAKARFPGVISEEINRILDAAATYHWQRNLVIHGHFKAHFRDGKVSTVAEGMVRKRYVGLDITDEHLERMYHEISFLAGRIDDLTRNDPKTGRYWLSSRSRSRLRAFLETHPSTPPKPRKIAPQHPPLRVLSLLHREPRRRGR